MQSLQLTALQLDLFWEDPEANRQQIQTLLGQSELSTDIILLPEMFTTGFTMHAAAQAESMNGPTLLWMRQLAARYQALVVGSLIIEEGGNYYNRLIAMTGEGPIGQYDKRHLFSIAEEDQHYIKGSDRGIFTYRGWKICPQICYDLRFPVYSRNCVDADGAFDYDLLLYVANWPEKRASHWVQLARARAIENIAYVAAVNRVGTDDSGFSYSGNSLITDFMGKDLAYEVGKSAILSVRLDWDALQEWREAFPIWKDADGFRIE